MFDDAELAAAPWRVTDEAVVDVAGRETLMLGSHQRCDVEALRFAAAARNAYAAQMELGWYARVHRTGEWEGAWYVCDTGGYPVHKFLAELPPAFPNPVVALATAYRIAKLGAPLPQNLAVAPADDDAAWRRTHGLNDAGGYDTTQPECHDYK